MFLFFALLLIGPLDDVQAVDTLRAAQVDDKVLLSYLQPGRPVPFPKLALVDLKKEKVDMLEKDGRREPLYFSVGTLDGNFVCINLIGRHSVDILDLAGKFLKKLHISGFEGFSPDYQINTINQFEDGLLFADFTDRREPEYLQWAIVDLRERTFEPKFSVPSLSDHEAFFFGAPDAFYRGDRQTGAIWFYQNNLPTLIRQGREPVEKKSKNFSTGSYLSLLQGVQSSSGRLFVRGFSNFDGRGNQVEPFLEWLEVTGAQVIVANEGAVLAEHDGAQLLFTEGSPQIKKIDF